MVDHICPSPVINEHEYNVWLTGQVDEGRLVDMAREKAAENTRKP